jgi:hypothetical protein
VLLNEGKEVEVTVEDREDDWIWITYYLDDEDRISAISICDAYFGKYLR